MTKFDFDRLFNLSLDMLCIASTDGYFRHVNASFQHTMGWTAEQMIDRSFLDFIHADDIEKTFRKLEIIKSGTSSVSFKNRFRCADGTYRVLQWTALPEAESDLFFAMAKDSPDLSEADQRFQLALEASPAALIMVNQNGIIQLVNRETERLFGYPRDRMIGETIEMLVPDDYVAQHREEREAFIHNPKTRPMGQGRHLRAVGRGGEEFPAEVGLNPVRMSNERYVLCTIVDLTHQKHLEAKRIKLAKELEEANAKLTKLAGTDKLTNLLNRRAFDEQLNRHILLMTRMKRAISLLMIDIDHFKRYNDKYGHPSGDEVLKDVADLLLRNARVTDVVARYGGEEFAIILPNTKEEGARQLAERFRKKALTHPWERGSLTLSIGAATIRFDRLESTTEVNYSSQIISEADRALYFSKGNGRDRVAHYSEIREAD